MKINKMKILELFKYGFVGVLTTGVNYGIFYLTFELFSINWQVATIIAWLISVIFAFIANRNFVFLSEGDNTRREVTQFFLFRIESLALEFVLMMLLIEIFGLNVLLTKLVINFIVIAQNYLACKYIVFSKKS